MPPAWLTALSWAALAVVFASTAWITYDSYGRGCRQHMTITEAVWPVTGLYFGPAAVAVYRAWGRPMSRRWRRKQGKPAGFSRGFTMAFAAAAGFALAGAAAGTILPGRRSRPAATSAPEADRAGATGTHGAQHPAPRNTPIR